MLVFAATLVYNRCEEVDVMTLAELVMEEMQTMPIHSQQQVLDFVQFLKQKEQQFTSEVDALIADNLPALKELAK